MSVLKKLVLGVVSVLLVNTAAFAEEKDPPSRVARLNYISGEISVQPGGVDEWVAGNINRPLTSADRVWADKDSRAELQLGGAALRLNSETSLTLVNVADNTVQVQLDQGTLNLHVVELYKGEFYEVDTPNLAFTVRKAGDYRFDVDNAGDTTVVTTFKGEGDVTGDGPAVRVRKNEQYTFRNGKSLLYAYTKDAGHDGFDDWCRVRADREDRSLSARYVSRYAVGYEDLDDYGRWETVSPYGAIWVPTRVAYDWAPYRYGHWVWISPWGWTWVDDASWGFAPFHYGRWVRYHNYWGWCPGPRHIRPYYAPALVAWVGGSHFGVGLSFGIGGGVGWFPLGWGEPYIPYYRHSRGYFQHVNVSNTRIRNITYITNNYYDHHRDITNIHYVNRNTPNAVTAVSNDVFRTSRPTRDSFVRVSAADVQRASLEREVRVRPTTNSVLGVNAGEHRAMPPERIAMRPGRGNRAEQPGADAGLNQGRQNRPSVGMSPGREHAPSMEPSTATVAAGRATRGIPRPPDRSTAVDTAEVERPSGIPRTGRDMNAGAAKDVRTATPSRVPRPPMRETPDSLKTDRVSPSRTLQVSPQGEMSRPGVSNRTDAVSSPTRAQRTIPRPPDGQVIRQQTGRVDRPATGPVVREERNVARPLEGQVMRRERQTEQVNRNVRPSSPPVREERPVTRAPEVSRPSATRTETPRETRTQSAPAAPQRQAAPARQNNKPESSRPTRENQKVENKSGGPQAGLRYPSPYNSVQSSRYTRSAAERVSYAAPSRSNTYSSYRSTPTASSVRASSNYSTRSYSSSFRGSAARYTSSSHAARSSQSASRGASRSSGHVNSSFGRHSSR